MAHSIMPLLLSAELANTIDQSWDAFVVGNPEHEYLASESYPAILHYFAGSLIGKRLADVNNRSALAHLFNRTAKHAASFIEDDLRSEIENEVHNTPLPGVDGVYLMPSLREAQGWFELDNLSREI